MEFKNTSILNSQFHGSWWPGDARSQGIFSRGIYSVLHEILASAQKNVIEGSLYKIN